jgi:hypothetical protein
MPKQAQILPLIISNARPAAGKSEIIQFLKEMDVKERKDDFHIGKIHVIDDFPYLWRWFEEDELLIQMEKNRIYTDTEGYFKENYLWDLLIKMLNLEYEKFLRDTPFPDQYTVFIEFSRGKEHGGYRQAFSCLSDQILEKASILYVDVPWEESLRKNRLRYNPDKPDSILQHSLPDEKLKRLYFECDFHEIASENLESITVNGYSLTYAIFDNQDDLTTKPTSELGERLKSTLDKLWRRYR